MHVFLLLWHVSQIHLSEESEKNCRERNCERILEREIGKGPMAVRLSLTLRSQAFLGISLRSERRSSCSLSNSSFPIGPEAFSFTGLSLNDLKMDLKNKNLNKM